MWEQTLKLPRRKFLHLAASAAALPAYTKLPPGLSGSAGIRRGWRLYAAV